MKKPASDQTLFLILVCLFAFVLRVGVIYAASSYRLADEGDNHFGFGWEMGRVAYSLVEGRGFSSPLPSSTGPTAMVGPVYPLILALIFKTFGVYSTASAIAARILQGIFSSLTCVFLYLGGRYALEERAGKLAALAWALFPLNIFFTVERVWETSLTSMLTAALFWVLLSARDSLSVGRWAAIGALLGISALVNTSLLVLIVPFGLSALWRHRIRACFPLGVGALACVVAISPWLVRNQLEFGRFMLRSNFPLEFRVGNNPLSYGQKIEAFHPSNMPALNKHWALVGETNFMNENREANSQFLSAHLVRFVFATVNRIVNYWTGAWIKTIPGYPNSWPLVTATTLLSLLGFLGLRQLFTHENPAAPMYAGSLFIYPVVYYITTSQPRFYHAITPLIIQLGACWIVSCWVRVAARSPMFSSTG